MGEGGRVRFIRKNAKARFVAETGAQWIFTGRLQPVTGPSKSGLRLAAQFGYASAEGRRFLVSPV